MLHNCSILTQRVHDLVFWQWLLIFWETTYSWLFCLLNGCCLYCYSSVFGLIVSRSFELKSCAFMTIVSLELCELNGGLVTSAVRCYWASLEVTHLISSWADPSDRLRRRLDISAGQLSVMHQDCCRERGNLGARRGSREWLMFLRSCLPSPRKIFITVARDRDSDSERLLYFGRVIFLFFLFFFIFFRPPNFRRPWADFHETLPHDAVCAEIVYLL